MLGLVFSEVRVVFFSWGGHEEGAFLALVDEGRFSSHSDLKSVHLSFLRPSSSLVPPWEIMVAKPVLNALGFSVVLYNAIII